MFKMEKNKSNNKNNEYNFLNDSAPTYSLCEQFTSERSRSASDKKEIYYLYGSSDVKLSQFASIFVPKLKEIIKKPNSAIVLSENEIPIIRYLNERGYRNCIIYHLGDSPSHSIGTYLRKGGFLSNIEMELNLKHNSHYVISK